MTAPIHGGHEGHAVDAGACDDGGAYAPKFLTTLGRMNRFEQPLRQLGELCGDAFPFALTKLHHIQRYFRRPLLVLQVDRDERTILNPSSTLLTIGKCAELNFHQGCADVGRQTVPYIAEQSSEQQPSGASSQDPHRLGAAPGADSAARPSDHSSGTTKSEPGSYGQMMVSVAVDSDSARCS